MKKTLNKILPLAVGTYFNILSFTSPKLVGRQSFNLFCKPRTGRIQPHEQEFLNTCSSTKTLDTPQGKVSTYLWNELGQKTVLLLHGWESNTARWRFLIPMLLEKNYRVVAIDAPAHGASSKKLFNIPAYADFMHQAILHYRSNFVIGHSIGGTSLIYYLTHYQHSTIEKIGLMGVPSELSHLVKIYTNMLKMSKRTVGNFYQFFEENFKTPIDYFSAKEFCKKIKIPTLVIHDEQDLIAPVADGIEFNKMLENSQLWLTRNLGHSLQDQAVYSKLISYLG